jgi:AraC-like DNA-binding protein
VKEIWNGEPMVDQFHTCRILRSPWPGVFGTDIESAREYGRHWHATFGFGLMERGAHRSLSGRGVVDAHVGEIITTNPAELHDGRPLRVATRRWRMVYLDPPALESMAREVQATAGDVRLTRPVFQDPTVVAHLRDLLRRLEHWTRAPHRSSDAALACEEALVRTCGLLLERYSTLAPRTEGPGDIARVCERLASDLVNTPSLSELAAVAGVSRYQLLRRFHRVHGLTPFRWQRQVRVERARALIARRAALTEAALGCGFSDQSHMTRAFVAHFGFTPGAWAAALRHEPA